MVLIQEIPRTTTFYALYCLAAQTKRFMKTEVERFFIELSANMMNKKFRVQTHWY